MSNGSRVDPFKWADVTKLIVTLHISANASKNFLHADHTELIIITNNSNLYHCHKLNHAPYNPTAYIYSMFLLIFLFHFSCEKLKKRFCIPRINLDTTSKFSNAMFITILRFTHYAYCNVCS